MSRAFVNITNIEGSSFWTREYLLLLELWAAIVHAIDIDAKKISKNSIYKTVGSKNKALIFKFVYKIPFTNARDIRNQKSIQKHRMFGTRE